MGRRERFARECAKRRGRHRSVIITRSRERIFIRYEIGPLLAGTAFGIAAVVAAILSKVIG